MPHNPYWNRHPVGGKPWEAEEDAILRAMTLEGKTYPVIAGVLKRSHDAVKNRAIAIISLEDREAANFLKRTNRIMPTKYQKTTHTAETRMEAVPPHVFEERNVRALAPRSLTAILMGDPPVGFSALGKRA